MQRIISLCVGLAMSLASNLPSKAFAQVTIPLDRQNPGQPILKCRFETFCSQDGVCDDTAFELAVYRDEKDQPFTLGIVRNQLVELRGQDAISFAEKQRNGSLSVTTLFRDGTATHARHTYTIKGIALQYYGSCEVNEKVF